MQHMELMIYKKGALYSAECSRCHTDNYTHEWAHIDHNERRDAMHAGTLNCEHCGAGVVNPETFRLLGRQYHAGHYSAPLDQTDLMYGRNLRALKRELRDMYG